MRIRPHTLQQTNRFSPILATEQATSQQTAVAFNGFFSVCMLNIHSTTEWFIPSIDTISLVGGSGGMGAGGGGGELGRGARKPNIFEKTKAEPVILTAM